MTYLPFKVLIGAILGVLTGLCLGEDAAIVNPVGLIYIRLMEAAVYPYIISSLLMCLGRLTPSLSLKLFKYGWKIYLLLMCLVFVILGLLTEAIPYASTIKHTPFIVEKLLSLLIPSNLFQALSMNYVPAVILFCVLFGLTLQNIQKKAPLLSLLEVVSRVSLVFWQKLVLFSPFAVFALLANTMGTLDVEQFKELNYYLLLFFLGTFSLTFWFLPAIAASLTPLSYREVLSKTKKALLISVSTTLSVASIPYLQRFIEQSLTEAKAKHAEKKEIVDTCLLVGYPFAQVGNAFIYLFIFFAAFYYNHAISDKNPIAVAFVSYLSSIGTATSTINSLSFLSGWLSLPETTTSFYVSILPLTRYGQVLASVMGIAFFALITSYAYFGLLEVKWKKLFFHLLSAVLFFFFVAQLIKPTLPDPGQKVYERYAFFNIPQKLKSSVTSRIVNKPSGKIIQNEDAFFRIQRTGIIHIGFNPDSKPFSYFNKHDELVGYDVLYSYALADSLHAKIEFIPYNPSHLIHDIQTHRFDLAIGGIFVSTEQLRQVRFSSPYLKSPPAFVTLKENENKFESIKHISQQKGLRIANFSDKILSPFVSSNFPGAESIPLKHLDRHILEKLEKKQIDAILSSEVQSTNIANSNAHYIASTPEDSNVNLLFAFMLNQHSPLFLDYLNYWLNMKREDGFQKAAIAHWIKGIPNQTHKHWNIFTYLHQRTNHS
jgi:Na+/H+-dicarboxylate symporter/ABC-type amino acid transport substrate-binding protein